jgi:chemotaxis signal transduction protein
MAEPRALAAGGRCFALPPGAAAIPAAPLRPVPLGAPGLLGLALLDGQALPVLAAAPGLPGGPAWVLLDGPAGRVILAGEALLEAAPPGAEPLAAARIAPRPAPPPLPASGGEAWAVPARAARGLPSALAAELGGLRMVLPFAALEHVLPLPRLRPAPGAGPAALGLALAGGEPVLVLDPARVLATGPPAEAPAELVVFRHAGRRLGLPCARLRPARGGEPTLAARLDALLPELGPAPLGVAAHPPAPEPSRALLLCLAGTEAFALPVEEVIAAIPPTAPAPAPSGGALGIRGVVAHRGEVLPVLDGGERLGLAPVLGAPGAEAPMLRLAGPRPVALAVTQVTGLRRVPERLVVPTAAEGAVAAIATLNDQPVPVCRAALLGDPAVPAGGRG